MNSNSIDRKLSLHFLKGQKAKFVFFMRQNIVQSFELYLVCLVLPLRDTHIILQKEI